MLLGVVGDGNRLVAGQRADHDVRAQLLHQALRLLDRRVRAVVRAADSHELERVAADRGAGPAVARLVRVLRLAAGELRHGRDDPGEVLVVERSERALTVGHDGDLDRRRRAPVGSRGRGERGDERRERRERNELPPSLESTHSFALLLSNLLVIRVKLGVLLSPGPALAWVWGLPSLLSQMLGSAVWTSTGVRALGPRRGPERNETARSPSPIRAGGERSTLSRNTSPISGGKRSWLIQVTQLKPIRWK